MEFLLLCFQLVEDSMIKLDRICREANVMLIFSRSYGLTSFVRISLKVICYTFMVKDFFFYLPFSKAYVGLADFH